MRILFSKTSSQGNATVIESSNGNLLCIDCGLKYSDVNKAIGYRLHECRTLLCTHKHLDHTFDMKEYRKRGMFLYAGKDVVHGGMLDGFYGELHHALQFKASGFEIIPLDMEHADSSGEKCKCFGFLIRDKSNGDKMLFATDTMLIPYTFPPLEFYALECNYVETDSYIDDLEAIERAVEMRRVRSHLSLQSCADFLAKQDLSKCKEIRLLHLSHSLTQAERDSLIPYIKNAVWSDDINVVF